MRPNIHTYTIFSKYTEKQYIPSFELFFSALINIIPFFPRFTNDIYEMTGYRPGLYWQVTWRYVGPFIVSCILLSSLVFMLINPPTYGAWNADEVRH